MTADPRARMPARAWEAPVLRPLDDAGRAAVEAACVLHRFTTGAAIAHASDPNDTLFVVVSGRVDVVRRGTTTPAGSAGDVLGEEAVVAGRSERDADLVAAEPSVVGLVPQTVLRRALARSGGAHLLGRTEISPSVPSARAQVPDRRKAGRSLLVLDEAACVSCGHCASACASTHDGVPRLARRGEREAPALLLLESCHHCTHPACLPACPTGAITREPDGRVRIRESLCTGCEACTKACAWDNLRMVPRGERMVAAKCDLCEGVARAPACVSACPTEALQRVDPRVVFGKARGPRAPLGGLRTTATELRARTTTWPTLVSAALVGLAWLLVHPGRVVGGAVLAVVFSAALLVAILRRLRSIPVRARVLHLAHVALGIVVPFAVLAHARSGSAFHMTVWSTILSGALTAAAYAIVPARLARVADGPLLLEEAEAHLTRTAERMFGRLSGRSPAAKALYAELVRPYAHASLGGLRTLLLAASPPRAAAKLEARARTLVEGRAHALVGLDELTKLAVTLRGSKARVAGTRLLRALVVLHVVTSAVALVLVAAHVLTMVRR